MTVTSTPIGLLSTQLQLLRATLADCTQFRTWCGAATQAQALARIYYFDVPTPALTVDAHAASTWSTYRPFAVVDFWPGVANVFEHDAVNANSWSFRQSGALWLHLEENYDTENDLLNPDEALLQFANSIGKILQRASTDDASFKGLLDLFGSGGYLAAHHCEVSELYRADEDQRTARGDFLAVDLAIDWGRG